MTCNRLIILSAISVAMLLVSSQAQAQVAITVGLQELYDDNVFLEDDSRSLPPELTDPNNLPEGTTLDSLEPIDGKKNDDFITVPSISIAGALPTGKNFDSAVEASVAALIFSDNNDESRLAIDSHLTFGSSETLLPEPFSFQLSSILNSQSSDISVAEGSPARQSQSHTANLRIGVTNWDFSKNWFLSSNYGLTRYDYLEEFTFQDREDRPFEEKGSDYLKNGLNLDLRNETSKRLTTSFNTGVDYTSFSKTDSNDLVVDQEEDLDRVGYGAGLNATYLVDRPLTISANVGFDGSHYPDREKDAANPTDVNNDDSQISLRFGGSAVYAPDATTALEASVNQTSGSDADGDRIITRSAALNCSRRFGERISLIVGGRFLQFNDGDELSDSTDRFEFTSGLNITLTESIALSLGYNYADQDSGDFAEVGAFAAGDSYTSHRAYIGVSSGIVGM